MWNKKTAAFIFSFNVLAEERDVASCVSDIVRQHVQPEEFAIWQRCQMHYPSATWDAENLVQARQKTLENLRLLHHERWCSSWLYHQIIERLALARSSVRLLRYLLRWRASVAIYSSSPLGRNFIPAVVRRDLGRLRTCRQIEYIVSGVWHKRPSQEVVYEAFPPDREYLASSAKKTFAREKNCLVVCDKIDEAKIWHALLPQATIIGVAAPIQRQAWQSVTPVIIGHSSLPQFVHQW